MKDGPISKLTITKTGHRPSQFKKISDALPISCADKNFQGLDEVLRTGRDLVETIFMPPYPNTTHQSTTHHAQASIVDPNDPEQPNDLRPIRFEMMEQTHVFDANLQKKLLLEYKQKFKNKSQEYAKFLADKKALIIILFGQCDETIKTKISLGATYATDRQAGRLSAFIKQMCTVYFGGDDSDLSYGPYR